MSEDELKSDSFYVHFDFNETAVLTGLLSKVNTNDILQ